jgi:SynChlorMet cassette radical SAM/SPASM protein ScmF
LAGSDGNGQAQADGIPPLARLYFYLTEGCNCACRHCWLAPKFDPDASRYPTLAVATFERVIAQARPLGLVGVKLTGGEPLLHPHLRELLAIVRREDLGLTVESNGLLLTRELAEDLASCKAAHVSVSMDGVDAATHDRIRGVPGSFAAATAAVEHLVAVGLKPEMILSVMRSNVDHVEPMVRLAERLGAHTLKFNVVQPTARGEALHDRGDTLGVAELIALGRRVETELAASTAVRLVFDYPMAFRPLSRLATPAGQGRCGILGIMGVLATGVYALCGIGEHVPELTFGHADEVALGQVWREASVLNDLRAGLPARLQGICTQCVMRTRCLGSCVAQNYYRSRDLFAPFWFCDLADQAGLFPESRRRPVPCNA